MNEWKWHWYYDQLAGIQRQVDQLSTADQVSVSLLSKTVLMLFMCDEWVKVALVLRPAGRHPAPGRPALHRGPGECILVE